MNNPKRQEWITQGYELVAIHGFKGINVEQIARSMQKNKSSFYHYMGDWELFEEALLEEHKKLAGPFAEKARACENVLPDMINLFLEHKTDIFFHKQLRIHRQKPAYKACFQQAYSLFEEAILDKWIAFLGMQQQPLLAAKILTLVSDNFLLRITQEEYSYEWMVEYMQEVAGMTQSMNG